MREFDRKNNYIPGTVINEVISSLNRTKNTSDDTKNRKQLRENVKKYLQKGLSHEEAIDLIMQDEEIVSKFDYLKKNGLDIRQCFINWTKGSAKEESQMHSDSEEER